MPVLSKTAAIASLWSVGGAFILSRQRSAADLRGQQLGISMPAAGPPDFATPAPRPLAGVDIPQAVHEGAKAVADHGAVSMLVRVDLKSGKLHMQLTSGRGAGAAGARDLAAFDVPVAWAHYNNTVAQNGWSYFSVASTEDHRVSKELAMYAAGFLEGYLSAKQIKSFRHNAGILMESDEEKHHALGNIQDLFSKSLSQIVEKAHMSPGAVLSDDNVPTDSWDAQARYALLQSWGILDAYNLRARDVADKPMSLVDLMVLNSDGETPELEMAYDNEEFLLRQSEREDASANSTALLQRSASHRLRGTAPPIRGVAAIRARRRDELRKLDDKAWRRIKSAGGRCSALIRLTADNTDLMVGHATFSDYSEMTRVFKYYDLPLGPSSVRRMGFSSYPGVAGSTDDYYLLDSGLVITETTISMLTDEPYDKLDDSKIQVPDFMRIMIANRLAKSAPEWAQLMTQRATGTYSSQWMVVDYNLFQPGKALQNGTFVVLEQVPGLSHSEDMSHRLQEARFWASENRAWYKSVRDSIGATDAEQLHGRLFSADKNPRANIFAATAPKVQTLADFRAEMRRNRWPLEVDGGDGNTPDHAIAARGDLDKDHPDANGAVDAKVTNACLAKRLACDAISGPTAATQKPFRWTDPKTGQTLFAGAPREGLPDVWNFDWTRMAPAADGPSALAAALARGDACEPR